MTDVNVLAIVVAAVAALIVSTLWYSAFAKQLGELSPAYADASGARPPMWKVGIELLRNIVVASLVAGLVDLIDAAGWTDGLLLGLALWIGLPVVLWTGAVMWERIPPKLAAIHSGDWLLKLLVIPVIVTVWR
jgi:hypothetical protein